MIPFPEDDSVINLPGEREPVMMPIGKSGSSRCDSWANGVIHGLMNVTII